MVQDGIIGQNQVNLQKILIMDSGLFVDECYSAFICSGCFLHHGAENITVVEIYGHRGTTCACGECRCPAGACELSAEEIMNAGRLSLRGRDCEAHACAFVFSEK